MADARPTLARVLSDLQDVSPTEYRAVVIIGPNGQALASHVGTAFTPKPFPMSDLASAGADYASAALALTAAASDLAKIGLASLMGADAHATATATANEE